MRTNTLVPANRRGRAPRANRALSESLPHRARSRWPHNGSAAIKPENLLPRIGPVSRWPSTVIAAKAVPVGVWNSPARAFLGKLMILGKAEAAYAGGGPLGSPDSDT